MSVYGSAGPLSVDKLVLEPHGRHKPLDVIFKLSRSISEKIYE